MTGGVHPGESLEDAAQRELGEEIGRRAGCLERVSSFDTSKSILHESATLFLAQDLSAVERRPDDTEFITVRPFPFADVLRRVLGGDITDAMTIIAVLIAANRLSAPPPSARA